MVEISAIHTLDSPRTSSEYEEEMSDFQDELRWCPDEDNPVRPHFIKEINAEIDRLKDLSHHMTDAERGLVAYHLRGAFSGPVIFIDDVSPSDMDAYEEHIKRLIASASAFSRNPCQSTYDDMRRYDLASVY